jgi:hypothetical protein
VSDFKKDADLYFEQRNRIIELEARNKELLYLIKFIYNPYSSPEETLRRLDETYEKAKKLLGKG